MKAISCLVNVNMMLSNYCRDACDYITKGLRKLSQFD